jgi:tRNA(His) guanylyltransferase
MKRDTMGTRMKTYEQVYSQTLTINSPVIIRVDGKSFHTFGRGLDKPFDNDFIMAMEYATKETAKQMMGFKVAYTQSDEASFLLTDYDSIETEGWFGYKLNKIVSISASLMTTYFNHKMDSMCQFDARCFVVPREEISNYFLWRAKDWHRNSIQMLAQSVYSSKQLYKKKVVDMHEMLYEKDINWSDLDPQLKNGTWIDRNLESYHNVLPNYESVNDFIILNQEALKK